MQQTNLVWPFRPFLICLGIAALGAALAFGGEALSSAALSVVGFVITVVGVALGIVSIVCGQFLYGRAALAGSWKAMLALRRRMLAALGRGPNDRP
jgi:hypothetical protein